MSTVILCFINYCKKQHNMWLDKHGHQYCDSSCKAVEEHDTKVVLRGPHASSIILKKETDRRGSILKAGLHLGSDCGLWAMPGIYGNDIPTEKPDPPNGRAQGLVPRLSITQKNTLIICVTE